MKVIISHDIDHLTFTEHWRDLFIPKYIVRAKIEWLSGKITFREMTSRILHIFSNRLHNLPELMEFDAGMGVPSTFFIGFNKGRGLVYSERKAAQWLQQIQQQGFNTGVHGNSGADFEAIQTERQKYLRAGGKKDAGIRMHYLNLQENTLINMAKAGYTYDSSVFAMRPSYTVGSLREFPVQIMDTYEIEAGRPFQKHNLAQAMESTKNRIREALDQNLPYLVIIFHDCYFSDTFSTWKAWYIWLIGYVKEQGLEFTSFE